MDRTNGAKYAGKAIDELHWARVDERTALWLQLTGAAVGPKEWIAYFQRPMAGTAVPVDLVELIETARGAMIYGWFFYPLATLGAQQCWRVLESGVRLKCKQAGIAITQRNKKGREVDRNFAALVDELLKRKLAGGLEEPRWDAVRALRNAASHPEGQMILDPGMARSTLELVVGTLNELFP